MMPDEHFGSLIAFTDIESEVIEHYKLWMHTWLAARERHVGLPVNTIARPRSYIVKQSFTALPGEEQTPVVIAVSDGFASEPTRRGDGSWDALMRFGIAVVCYGSNGSARQLCGHYQTALSGIATHNRSINGGGIQLDDFVNLRIEDIDEEAIGRSMAAVRMEVIYKIENFASERPALLIPPDEIEPQPDDPRVETVIVDVENTFGLNVEAPGDGEETDDVVALESTTVIEADSVFESGGIIS